MTVYENINELIGNTPLVRLSRLSKGLYGDVAVKLEYMNPGGSVKDRPALSMIDAAEKQGILKEGATVIEPTSGNTGIGLAQVCAVKGYRLIIVMPDSMSKERRKIIRAYGAELELTPAAEGMKGAIRRAEELAAELGNAFIPSQFSNQANPEIHRRSTAEEIWRDTDGTVSALVAGVGTGGTITGAGSSLKEKNSEIRVYAVEPVDSPVLSGGESGSHKIQGIGAGFVPDVLDTAVYDEVLTATTEETYDIARKLAREEGIFCGISSGAVTSAALRLAAKPEFADKLIVAVLASGGERYLSTPLYDFEV